MKVATVKFSNGATITTEINGTIEEIGQCYSAGRVFNLGDGEFDLMASVVSCKVFG